MASQELNLIMVRSSMQAVRRAVTRRAFIAAERRQLSRSTSSSVAIARASRTRSAPTYKRWQSTQPEAPKPDQTEQPGPNTQLAKTLQESDTSELVSEVNIQPDPYGVLPPDHPALSILGQSTVVVQRQLELMTTLIGFEQANRYIVMNGQGETIGYIAEQDHGVGRTFARQLAKTHRSFTTYIFDKDQKEVLRIHRPFSYINSKIRIYDPIPEGGYDQPDTTDVVKSAGSQTFVENGQVSPLKVQEMRIIGECQSEWTPLRRKYNLFSYRTSGVGSDDTATLDSTQETAIEAHMTQFSAINEPMLSWDFSVKGENDQVIGSVNRTFQGFAREIFTDTGVYFLKMDAAARTAALENAQGEEIERFETPGLTLDQRAVMIATAVSIDFDYFSRNSRMGSGMPLFIPFGGAAESGAVATGAGAAAGEAGAGLGAAEGAAGALGRGAMGAGAIEGGIAGAGTMAGYEAMQRGVYGDQSIPDDASPQAAQPPDTADQVEPMENQPGQDEVWGAEQDPWDSVGDAAEEGAKGWLDTITDWFS